MIEITEVHDKVMRIAFLEMLLEGAKSEAEEKERLIAIVSNAYGKVGMRLARNLVRLGQLRTGVAMAMIHGFILRRHETAEYALVGLTFPDPQSGKAVFDPARLNQFIVRILTEEGIQNKEATLIKVMPIGMLPKGQSFEMIREKRKEVAQKPLRLKTTRTQSQIDAALAGSTWEGAIIASNAEFIPPGFIRLIALEAKGIKRHNLSNPIENVLKKAGVEQIYIVKGYYREDFLRACALKLREPARSQLLEAIESESIALLGEVIGA